MNSNTLILRRTRSSKLVGLVLLALGLLLLLLSAQGAQAGDQPAEADGLGSIAGTVTDENGVPLAGVIITGYLQQSADGLGTLRVVTTTASGAYKLNLLRTGVYRLRFQAPSSAYAVTYYNQRPALGLAEEIPVAGNAITGIDVRLTLGARITGRVMFPEEIVPDEGTITLLAGQGDRWDFVQSTLLVTPTARYTFSQVLSGTYRVCATGGLHPTPHTRDWFSGCYGGPNTNDAETIMVGAGETKSGVDFVLGEGQFESEITGTITAENSLLAGIRVNLYSYFYPAPVLPPPFVYTTTNSLGRYRIGGLSAGTYYVVFTDPSERFATEYYDDQSPFQTNQVQSIQVNGIVSNVNAELGRAGQISGQVRLLNGQPVPFVQVRLLIKEEDFYYRPVNHIYSTDQDGHFVIKDLWPGVYLINFTAGQSFSEFYGPPPGYDSSMATELVITSGRVISGLKHILGPDETVHFPLIAQRPVTETATPATPGVR